MTIVFSVLGKIFFVLLVILCILLFLLCVILFCPVHYKVSLEKGEELLVKGVVRWLFFLVYCPFSYEEGKFQSAIRICGINLGLFGKKKEKPVRKKKPAGEDGEQESKEIRENLSEELVEKLETGEEGEEKSETSEEQNAAVEDGTAEEDTKKTSRTEKEEEAPKKKLSEKIPAFRDKVHGIHGKIKEKSDWASDVKVFLKEENTKEMVCILKDNVVHLLRKIKPKVLKGYIEFGTGDPCQTGQALGGLACLYAYYGEKVRIVPDFNERKLLGHLYVRGRIFLITFVVILIRILFSRGWKRFMKEIKELKEAL